MIPVIIYGNEVSIFVEIKLVGISDAVGKHLKIAAIGIHSEDGSSIGIFVTIALLIGEIGAHVSDSPVNSSVRADNQARHSMARSEEHTSELQSRGHLVCRLLLEKKKKKITHLTSINHQTHDN